MTDPTPADVAAAEAYCAVNIDLYRESVYLAGVMAERERVAALVERVGTMMAPEYLADRIRRGPTT